MLDIDNFKLVNDRYGHAVGDIVLQQVASTILGNIRENDMCGRYGGEEFLVVLNNTSRSLAIEVANRIRSRIAEKIININIAENFSVSVSVSGGVSYLQGRDSIKDLIQRADQGLYLAKRSGKNCIKTVDNA
ncbi:Diguanylate cyclase DosC [Sporomusa silvacetica DSM 10669]|uniref:Diguanylate cyclase DosC n=2 Tax=Sporomusa silvacetica TaxID=55504 RepID=A0ABZ3INI0_9FIRM|nr:diguanylate cyclase DosC [Sporomusa silvacetica DSM 10669]